MNNQKGFTLFEILVGVGVMVAISPFIMNLYTNSQKSQTATQLADTSKSFASAYNQHIKQNYASLYEQAIAKPGQVIAIKYNDVKNSGEFSSLNTYNFNLTPCVLYKYNPSGKQIQAIMVFTSSSKSKPIDKIVGSKSAMTYGLGSGYYDNGQVKGGTWSLANSADFLSAASQCGGQIAQYSPVINLAIGNDFPNIGDTNNYLSRLSDDKSKGGDQQNENTMQTDVYMASTQGGEKKQNAIYLNGSENDAVNKVYLSSTKGAAVKNDEDNSNVKNIPDSAGIYINAATVTRSITATITKTPYEACDPKETSTIVRQRSDTNLPLYGQLQCTHNPIQCDRANGGFCYTPITDLAIRYHPNVPSFNCPIGYVDPSIQATADTGTPYKPAAYGTSCRRCNWTGYCWRTYEAQGCNWKATGTTITNINPKTSEQYTIYTGVSAQTTWSAYNAADGDCGCSGNQTTQGLVTGVACTTSNPVLDVH